MSKYPATIGNFLESVPVCQQVVKFQTLREIFQSGQHQRLVVLDRQLSPLGLIDGHRLLAYLFHRLSTQGQFLDNQPEEKLLFLSESELNCLMETNIVSLPSTLTIQDFLPYFQAFTSNPIFAVVDAEKKFLGLLDYQEVLRYLAREETIAETKPELHQSLLACLNPIIEDLPIPLMLHTVDGKIIAQNLLWRQQIKNLECQFHQLIPVLATSSSETQESSPSFSGNLSAEVVENFPNWSFSARNVQDIPSYPQGIWKFYQLPIHLPIFSQAISLVIAKNLSQQQRQYSQITAQKTLNKQILNLKNDLLQSFSHELKSPLTAIMGLSSLLQEPKLGTLNQRQGTYARQIAHSTQQLMTLINQVVQLIRLEQDHLELEFKPIAIKPFCQDILATTIGEVAAKTRKISLNIEPGLETIIADEICLRQMLVNLLKNAINFTPKGGEITLDIHCFSGWITFSLSDNGVGITAKSQPLVFQTYQCLETSLHPVFSLTGLELILTKLMAAAHQGDLSFISQPGKGSCFTILLPASLPAAKAIDVSLNKLVLIIGSLPEQINDLNAILKEMGYLVTIARTNLEAQDKARKLKPALIFLNPNLSLDSGWDVLTLLKSEETSRNIPIIITAAATEKEQALRMQAEAFLSLPIEKNALVDCLEHFYQVPPLPWERMKILWLSPVAEGKNASQFEIDNQLELALHDYTFKFHHHLIYADSLEQSEILARIWNLDVLLLDGRQLSDRYSYLRRLSQCDSLASIPLVTLDAKTSQVANQIKSLSVFPYLSPVNVKNLDKLLEVIQIAIRTKS